MERKIIRLAETDSTNSYIRGIPDEADTLTVVTAGFQTAGRGQGSNVWESERGKNLLASISFQPMGVAPLRQFILSEAGALAVGHALSLYTNDISLKWPNDIYWRDRKISGTLIETAVSRKGLTRCIYGVGVNVNQETFLSDAPNPVSLYQILGHSIPVDEVLHRLLDSLEVMLRYVGKGDYDFIRKSYHEHLYRRFGSHPYRDAGGAFEAEIVRVEDDGHLVVRDSTGRERSYAFKEVAFV